MLTIEAEEYLTWLAVEQGRSRNTLAAYRRDLAAYEVFLAGRGAGLVDADMAAVEDHLADRRAAGLSAASLARALAAIRGLHRFLVEEGDRCSDPTEAVAAPRRPRPLPKALSEEEVGRLLDSVSGDSPPARRDLAMLELLYGTGMRVGELVRLDLADMAPDRGLLKVTGKGDKERLVPLGRHAAAAVERWLEPGGRRELQPRRWARRGDAEALFLNARGGRLTRQGAWDVLKRRARAAGLDAKVHPHVLRHSCATHMLAHGADIRVVQELLGHVSIATTQIYTRVSTEHLRRVYEQAHPRAVATPGK